MFQFVKSQKGNDLLAESGYIYKKERITKDKTIWKCVEYKKGCKGRVHTTNDNLNRIGSHNHVPSAANVEKKKLMEKI